MRCIFNRRGHSARIPLTKRARKRPMWDTLGALCSRLNERKMATLRLLIVDDHKMFRDGLRALIDTNVEDAEVIGEAGNGREAVKLARRLKPDVVLMDISMPELNGIEAVKQITLELPECVVIALSMHQSNDYVTRMLGAGAKGYIIKNAAFDELSEALRIVAQGDVYLGRRIATALVDDYQRLASKSTQGPNSDLSPREREVLQLVAEGYRTAEIADKLSLSVKTIETHRGHILQKLQLSGVAAMTKYAIRHGIVSI